MFDLSGKVALVTGASYGLGVTFADALAEAGADLALTARSGDLLEQTAKQLSERGRTVSWYTGDVTVESDVDTVVTSALEDHGHIDILVNNAGVSDLRGLPSEHFDDEMFMQILQVDVLGVWHYARRVGRHMLERGAGSIINIGSILGEGGSEFVTPAYYAAKGAVTQLTRQLAVEWGDRGVRVNCISPNYFVSEMTRPLFDMLGLAPWIESRTPMRRMGEPDDLRGPIVFLAADESSYVSGVNLCVDGAFNASRGAWQIRPGHHVWNDADKPMIGQPYPGLVPLPNEEWKLGVPGIHR
jgi:gluconate 5-dehydrogenase